MKKPRTVLYVKANLEEHQFVYTGIEFHEFIEFVSIENLILLQSNFMFTQSRPIKKFYVTEGGEEIARLANDDVYNYGDFCFVDYKNRKMAEQLAESEVAELLYMAHMLKPLKKPFFNKLQNKYAYLAHDDGWFCKLFCKENIDFIEVFAGKLKNYLKKKTQRRILPFAAEMKEELLQSFTEGMLIDLDEIRVTREKIEICFYEVGDYYDMNIITNDLQEIKDSTRKRKILSYAKKQWSFM